MSLFSHSYTSFFFRKYVSEWKKFLFASRLWPGISEYKQILYCYFFVISKLSRSFIPYRSYEDKNYLRPCTFRPNNNRRRQNTFSIYGKKQNNRHSNGQRRIVYVRLHFVPYGGTTGEWMWWYKSMGNGNIMEHNINSDRQNLKDSWIRPAKLQNAQSTHDACVPVCVLVHVYAHVIRDFKPK